MDDDDRPDRLHKIEQQQSLAADTISGLLTRMREKLTEGGFTPDQSFELCRSYLADVVPVSFVALEADNDDD